MRQREGVTGTETLKVLCQEAARQLKFYYFLLSSFFIEIEDREEEGSRRGGWEPLVGGSATYLQVPSLLRLRSTPTTHRDPFSCRSMALRKCTFQAALPLPGPQPIDSSSYLRELAT